jgi:hypothetical protein
MSRTVTIREVLWRVCAVLQDSDPQYMRWPEIELIQWLNDAQRALFKYLPQVGARVDAVKWQTGTRQDITKLLAANVKPMDGSTQATDVHGMQLIEVVRNMGGDGITPGRPVSIIDRQKLDAIEPNWHASTGTVVRHYAYSPQVPRVLYVWPGILSTANVWGEIHWIAEPDVIPAGGIQGAEIYKFEGVNAAVIGVHNENVDELVNYVVARALLKDGKNTAEMGRAMTHAQMFVGSINARASAATGNNPNLKTLPLMAEPVAAAS